MKHIFIFLLLIANLDVCSQQIILDESYDDWQSATTNYKDKSGDGNSSGVDITDVKFSNDDKNLFVYLDLTKEINIQENNKITIFIDADNSTSTGLQRNGIGVDISYTFGDKAGKIYLQNNAYDVFHDEAGLITSPTVTSERFEFCLSRSIGFNNLKVNMGAAIRIIISDETNSGDKAPDTGSYLYELDQSKIFTPQAFKLSKKSNEVRITGYNVLKDNLFAGTLQSNYKRIFKAINPDIIGFCEIYDNSSAQTAALMETFLPSSNSQKWYHAEAVPDIRVVSRFPIVNARNIDGNGAFHINLGTKQLLYIVAHLPCCDNETGRQAEVDKIMSFIRSVKYGISTFQIPVNSPIVIVGDMNLVGYKAQQETFLSGNIGDNTTYGPDFEPDWDNTELEEAKPLTTSLPYTFTWYNDFGKYSAGRLDYIIYTGSVMSLQNSFALWTPAMTNADLTAAGLQKEDIPSASDHLPVIADFNIEGKTGTNEDAITLPFFFTQKNGEIAVESDLTGKILISDTAGRILFNLEKDAPGEQVLHLPELSGLFIFTFETNQGVYSVKFFR